MTATTPPAPDLDRHRLPAVLDAAAHASADAHDATRALTDTVLACQYLPAEVYQYAPHLSQAVQTLTAAGRRLAAATGHATANPTSADLHALHLATADLTGATAALRHQTGALMTAASWYSAPTALPSTTSPRLGGQQP